MSVGLVAQTNRKVTILYGSQTGTAQDVAECIGRDAFRHHMEYTVSPLDCYNVVDLISESLVIFIVATTGQGDPPTNMKKFWHFIWKKNLPTNSLTKVRYAVLGLGDSSYQKFNFVAKKLHKRLAMLGAEQIMELGLADDQHELGYSSVANAWMKTLWSRLLELSPLPPGLDIVPRSFLLPPKYCANFVTHESGGRLNQQGDEQLPVDVVQSSPLCASSESQRIPSESCPFSAELIGNERVTAADHWQDVRLLTFDVSGSGIRYSAGDVLMVLPENLCDTVNEFINLLGLDPNALFVVSDGASLLTLPSSCSVRYLVTKYLDINSIPKKYFWELMAKFTDSDLEREKLMEFCSSIGQEELFEYCHRPRRTVLEVLRDFPGATQNIPFSYIFDMIGPMRPRAFSIASSQMVTPNAIQLLVAVVKYKTKLFAPRLGVCSSYLASLNPSSGVNHRVKVWVESGTITFPSSQTPVIMVGPGTGCAPFRGFIQQRAIQSITGNYLFFGCRNKEKDFLCRDEWKNYENTSSLVLFVAFSRDQENKVYVQHVISQQAELIWNLIDQQKAWFFVAGNAKNMPSSVREELKRVIMIKGGRTEDDAERYLNEMDRSHRYQCETWS